MKPIVRRRTPAKATTAPERRRGALPEPGDLSFLALVLTVFVFMVIGRRIGLPFVGDDYVFLDKTRFASFARLWSPVTSVDFGW